MNLRARHSPVMKSLPISSLPMVKLSQLWPLVSISMRSMAGLIADAVHSVAVALQAHRIGKPGNIAGKASGVGVVGVGLGNAEVSTRVSTSVGIFFSSGRRHSSQGRTASGCSKASTGRLDINPPSTKAIDFAFLKSSRCGPEASSLSCL